MRGSKQLLNISFCKVYLMKEGERNETDSYSTHVYRVSVYDSSARHG